MKSVLISIHPKWCELIASGEKTVEVRKTRPKIETPFKVYIYETRAQCDRPIMLDFGVLDFHGRGQVIGEVVCDEITEMYVGRVGTDEDGGYICLDTTSDVLRKQACLTEKQLYDYSNGSKLYGLHLSEVKLYPEPKDLSCFRKPCKNELYCEECGMYREHESKCRNKALIMYRPPQSWCYVKEVIED